jgi:serine/threonine-protein kinase TTK/MPS1
VVSVQGQLYSKLESLGKGGSSQVYRVLDGQHRMMALKEVDLREADAAAVRSFRNEIALLERLQGEPNIIVLHNWEHDASAKVLRIIMECGDVDMASMLRSIRRDPGEDGRPPFPVIDENHLRLYFQQMLVAVAAVHRQQIVHSDLKPANFLVVKGILKLIDFGIATKIQVRLVRGCLLLPRRERREPLVCFAGGGGGGRLLVNASQTMGWHA